MSLNLQALLDGPQLPVKSVYIDALEDTVEIQPVPLERYRAYKDAEGDQDQELITICIAESLSKQQGMTLDEATELATKVQAKIHPAAYDELANAVLETMFGSSRMKDAAAKAGNV